MRSSGRGEALSGFFCNSTGGAGDGLATWLSGLVDQSSLPWSQRFGFVQPQSSFITFSFRGLVGGNGFEWDVFTPQFGDITLTE